MRLDGGGDSARRRRTSKRRSGKTHLLCCCIFPAPNWPVYERAIHTSTPIATPIVSETQHDAAKTLSHTLPDQHTSFSPSLTSLRPLSDSRQFCDNKGRVYNMHSSAGQLLRHRGHTAAAAAGGARCPAAAVHHRQQQRQRAGSRRTAVLTLAKRQEIAVDPSPARR